MLGHFGADVQRVFNVGRRADVAIAERVGSFALLRGRDMQRDFKSLRIGIRAEVEEPEEPMMVSELPLGLDVSRAPI